jgi:hypothetical protein
VLNSNENLLKLLQLSGGLIAAMDGLWFLTVEEKFGNSEAIKLDKKVWEKYIHILVKRMRNAFGLLQTGIGGIKEIIELDPLFLINDYEIPEFSKERMILRVNRCPVLESMEKAGRKKFVCESTTGLYFKNIAKEIDNKVSVHPLKLPPRNFPEDVCCEWLFELEINYPAARNL